MIKSWFPTATINEIADVDIVNNLGIFDITVNGVLVHSRKCDTRTYGVYGHEWLRDKKERQNGVWHAINSVSVPCDAEPGCKRQKTVHDEFPNIVVRASSQNARHSACFVEMVQDWFCDDKVQVEQALADDDPSSFEVLVNGVLLHSNKTQEHGFLDDHDEHSSQQSLVWRSISDLLRSAGKMAVKGA